MPAKFTAFTTELCIARILERELNERAVKSEHFEPKNITFDKNKFTLLLDFLCKCCIGAAVLIQVNTVCRFKEHLYNQTVMYSFCGLISLVKSFGHLLSLHSQAHV